jgi:hypothetical protein
MLVHHLEKARQVSQIEKKIIILFQYYLDTLLTKCLLINHDYRNLDLTEKNKFTYVCGYMTKSV